MTYRQMQEFEIQACNGKRVSECNPHILKRLISTQRATIKNGIVTCSIVNSETQKFLNNSDKLIESYNDRERHKRKKMEKLYRKELPLLYRIKRKIEDFIEDLRE